MNINVVPKRPNKKGLWYLKADNEIIKRSFNKKKLLAIKQKIEEGIIDIEDVKKQYILESDIELWMEEIEWKKELTEHFTLKKRILVYRIFF